MFYLVAVNFNQSLYSFEEGTVAKFVITINKKPLIDFTVEVKVTDVSTIAGTLLSGVLALSSYLFRYL